MSVSLRVVQSVPESAEVSVALVIQEAVKTGLGSLGVDEPMLNSAGFTGKADQVYSQPADGRILGLVGLGPAADATSVTLRRAGAAVARTWKRNGRIAVTVPLADDISVTGSACRQALAEGIVLGDYRYRAYKSKSNGSEDASGASRLRRVDIVGSAAQSDENALDKGAAIAAGVCLARDLVNEPGGSLTPKSFAHRAVSVAREAGLQARVWKQKDIKREKLGGLLGVNRGSSQPARFVQLTYRPDHHPEPEASEGVGVSEGVEVPEGGDLSEGVEASEGVDLLEGVEASAGGDLSEGVEVLDSVEETSDGGGATASADEFERHAEASLALVGKGITFDAGGLSIKTTQGMMKMKMDMAGAAAVIGAMSVLPVVSPNVTVRAYLPMTDNMLGGDATRPGDVLTIRNGMTIEVANTDAEGRLVLADALSLACESEPDAIVDLATLTGACMVALGPRIAGLMSNNESWAAQVRKAADTAGERVWPLPLPKDYESQFESAVADMKNIGTVHGGALTAGLILQKFVADSICWAHLDIAGPAFSDTDDGENCKGGTGFGVRTLVELVENFTKP